MAFGKGGYIFGKRRENSGEKLTGRRGLLTGHTALSHTMLNQQ